MLSRLLFAVALATAVQNLAFADILINFNWVAPISRIDGTLLPPSDIDHFLLYDLTVTPAAPVSIAADKTSYQLTVASGLHKYCLSTVDIYGIESDCSDPVLVSLTKPNKITLNIRISVKTP